MKFGIVVFPGSNCDHDAWYAVARILGETADFIWHDASRLGAVFSVILIYGVELRPTLVTPLDLSGASPHQRNPPSALLRGLYKLLIPTERSLPRSLLSSVIHVH